MALGKNTERMQITFNKDKKNDKMILDYLESCYDRNAKIKELLYSVIVSQGVIPTQTVSNSDEGLLTFTNGEQKVETISNDVKLLSMESNVDKKKSTMTNSEEYVGTIDNDIEPLETISINEEQEVKEDTEKEQDLDIGFEIKEVVKKDTNKRNDDFDINNFMNQIENLNYDSF